ncbi:MAG TPA: hypothetical protein VE567_03110, partial [Sphingomonas sp.]|nr:hypothetical protein [Sphingomonas sp.]
MTLTPFLHTPGHLPRERGVTPGGSFLYQYGDEGFSLGGGAAVSLAPAGFGRRGQMLAGGRFGNL